MSTSNCKFPPAELPVPVVELASVAVAVVGTAGEAEAGGEEIPGTGAPSRFPVRGRRA